MVNALSSILKEAAKLPKSEQEALAAIIREELLDEERWSDAFSRSQPQLERLARSVQKEKQAGTIRRMKA
ncbi:MAG: hypothetical protein HYR64_10725 [Fimbriimonas ginsengisoli]|uniref:Addiction module protein n=1 Tax=Fimbriimonas ginsengisoli TaxID=1005039 RepID=A0A931LU84_FIMGI|nr:hypothetical protein [Fimbriimonas ginsengisoli]